MWSNRLKLLSSCNLLRQGTIKRACDSTIQCNTCKQLLSKGLLLSGRFRVASTPPAMLSALQSRLGLYVASVNVDYLKSLPDGVQFMTTRQQIEPEFCITVTLYNAPCDMLVI